MLPFQMFNLRTRRGKAGHNAAKRSITRQQQWVRGVLVWFGTVVFVCFLAADPVLRHFRKSSFRDAIPQTGVATVAMIVPPQANFEGGLKQEGDGFINVRFQGGLYKVNSVRQFAQLHENQPVQIVYRVSKRGDVAVDSAEPMPTPSAGEPSSP